MTVTKVDRDLLPSKRCVMSRVAVLHEVGEVDKRTPRSHHIHGPLRNSPFVLPSKT